MVAEPPGFFVNSTNRFSAGCMDKKCSITKPRRKLATYTPNERGSWREKRHGTPGSKPPEHTMRSSIRNHRSAPTREPLRAIVTVDAAKADALLAILCAAEADAVAALADVWPSHEDPALRAQVFRRLAEGYAASAMKWAVDAARIEASASSGVS